MPQRLDCSPKGRAPPQRDPAPAPDRTRSQTRLRARVKELLGEVTAPEISSAGMVETEDLNEEIMDDFLLAVDQV